MTQQTYDKARELQFRITSLQEIRIDDFIRRNTCTVTPISHDDYIDIKQAVEKIIETKLTNYKKQFQKL